MRISDFKLIILFPNNSPVRNCFFACNFFFAKVSVFRRKLYLEIVNAIPTWIAVNIYMQYY